MIFLSNFDRRKVNPLMKSKFWYQVCLPSLPYGTELFALTPTLLPKLNCCQQWFLKNVFYVSQFAPKQLLLKWSESRLIESEIALRRLLFVSLLLSGDKMASVVCKLFEIRANGYIVTNIVSIEVLPSICKELHTRNYTSMLSLTLFHMGGFCSPIF